MRSTPPSVLLLPLLTLIPACLPEITFVRVDAGDAATDIAADRSTADASLDVLLDAPVDTQTDASLDAPEIPPAPCAATETRCDGRCVTLSSDAQHCGRCNAPCAAPTGGSASCRASVCIPSCPPGTLLAGDACEMPAPPKLLWPSPTAHVAGRHPTLWWRPPPGVDRVRIELCRTADCATPLIATTVAGGQLTVEGALPAGVVFWRARSVVDGAMSSRVSPTWQFVVPPRDAMGSAAWGNALDYNGDGRRDVAVWNPSGLVEVYLGGATGLATMPAVTLRASSGDLAFVSAVGDVNGDGYGDLVATVNGSTTLFPGGVETGTGLSGLSMQVQGAASVDGLEGIGDVNGDGYGDLAALVTASEDPSGPRRNDVLTGREVLSTRWTAAQSLGATSTLGFVAIEAHPFSDVLVWNAAAWALHAGSGAGVRMDPSWRISWIGGGQRFVFEGDVNGDGLSDASLRLSSPLSPGESTTLLLSPAPYTATQSITSFGSYTIPVGDVDGDGLSDCVARSGTSLRVHRGTAMGYATTPFATLALATGTPVASAGSDVNGDGFDDVLVVVGRSLVVVLGGASAPLRVQPAIALSSSIVAL